jgi:hypothetical protein
MVDVVLSLSDLQTPATPALVDTGAPLTLFPRGMAELLEISLPDLRDPSVETVTMLRHDWPVYCTTVTLTLPPFEDMTWESGVRFALEDGLPFALLGYEGFLNRWVVTVNGAQGYLVVEPAENFYKPGEAVDPYEVFLREWPDIY